jgi:probable nitrogen fixation protein
MSESLFLKELVKQIRALDMYGVWEKEADASLLTTKYIKTKEQLKEIPIIADISKETITDLRMILQAVALAFEGKTGVMANVCLEMSHEGFGRGVVIADKIVLMDKYFKDAHRFSFPTLEKLTEEGDKYLAKAVETYEKFKPCLGV